MFQSNHCNSRCNWWRNYHRGIQGSAHGMMGGGPPLPWVVHLAFRASEVGPPPCHQSSALLSSCVLLVLFVVFEPESISVSNSRELIFDDRSEEESWSFGSRFQHSSWPDVDVIERVIVEASEVLEHLLLLQKQSQPNDVTQETSA